MNTLVLKCGVLLTLKLALVLVHHLVFSNQDLGSDFQAHHTGTRHEEEHDKLLAHHTQGLVLTARCSQESAV